MGHFNIDIERLYHENELVGRKLLGVFCIQYPVYCIHANITDATPDPMNNIDRIIVDFLNTNPNLTPHQIGTLIGSSKTFVELRLDILVHDGLVKHEYGSYTPIPDASRIFKDKSVKREHLRSFDFYLDGLDFTPLPSLFYTIYRSHFISEHDVQIHTNKKGEPYYSTPFGPDMVHTPPNKEEIIAKIFEIPIEKRSSYNIPLDLVSVNEISFTRLGFQILVATTLEEKILHKELIDGFAIHSLNEKVEYLEFLKERVKIFFPRLSSKISNLELRLFTAARKSEDQKIAPVLTTNWPEIDKYSESEQRCFNFSSEDIIEAMSSIFNIPNVNADDITITETCLEINISKQTLIESNSRQKLLSDLIRKREYKFGSLSNNVFVLFLHYKTTNPFVLEVIRFRELIDGFSDKRQISGAMIALYEHDFSHPIRELILAAGEFDLLEQLDIEKFMTKI